VNLTLSRELSGPGVPRTPPQGLTAIGLASASQRRDAQVLMNSGSPRKRSRRRLCGVEPDRAGARNRSPRSWSGWCAWQRTCSRSIARHPSPSSAARGRPPSRFTGVLALALDERQYDAERGPCLDAAQGGERLLIRDMAEETRWPRYNRGGHRQPRSGARCRCRCRSSGTSPGRSTFTAQRRTHSVRQRSNSAETFSGQAAVAVAKRPRPTR